MTPFFFGRGASPLFGVHHAPAGGRADTGVVICAPGPQEYGRAHWALRRIAGRLASLGLHVLRFDWTGVGDSAGEPDAASLATWREDVRAAVAELVETTSVRRVSLLGLRLGASVAATAGIERAVERLVLWEPVVRGDRYLDELRAVERVRALRMLHPPRAPRTGPPRELLGFAVGEAQWREWAAFDLRSTAVPRAGRVVLVAGEDRAQDAELLASWRRAGVETSRELVRDPPELGRDPYEGALLSTAASESVVRALAGDIA